MKKLELQHTAYKQILNQFKKHLQQVNYSKDTILGGVNALKEYLCYLEKTEVKLSENKDLTSFFDYLKKRKNRVRGAGLSIAYLHKYRSFIKLFYTFLSITKSISEPIYPSLPKPKSNPKVLTSKEVQKLFNCCDESLLGKRNKALLAVYYGLGLRRKEGVQLNIDELDFSKEEILVAKSKTGHQRIVPMSDHVKAILDDYIFNVREKLVPKDKSTTTVLVTERGKSLSVETASYILRKLIKESKIKSSASIHTLRHSIATHLLQSGMKLESIALFLGHKSLDSTQIYTHLTESEAEVKASRQTNTTDS